MQRLLKLTKQLKNKSQPTGKCNNSVTETTKYPMKSECPAYGGISVNLTHEKRNSTNLQWMTEVKVLMPKSACIYTIKNLHFEYGVVFFCLTNKILLELVDIFYGILFTVRKLSFSKPYFLHNISDSMKNKLNSYQEFVCFFIISYFLLFVWFNRGTKKRFE